MTHLESSFAPPLLQNSESLDSSSLPNLQEEPHFYKNEKKISIAKSMPSFIIIIEKKNKKIYTSPPN